MKDLAKAQMARNSLGIRLSGEQSKVWPLGNPHSQRFIAEKCWENHRNVWYFSSFALKDAVFAQKNWICIDNCTNTWIATNKPW